MAPHAEQLQHIDEHPEFASTSLSADFIKSYFLLNTAEGGCRVFQMLLYKDHRSFLGFFVCMYVCFIVFLIVFWVNRWFTFEGKEIE